MVECIKVKKISRLLAYLGHNARGYGFTAVALHKSSKIFVVFV